MLEYGFSRYVNISDGDYKGLLRENPKIFTLSSSPSNIEPNRIQFIVQDVNDYFCSDENDAHPYFEVTFHNYYLALHSYTFDCTGFQNGSDFPVTWVVSGFTGNEWENISYVSDAKLNHNSIGHTYVVNSRKFYQKFKFSQNGLSIIQKYFFCFTNFDMFGDLTTNPIQLNKNTVSKALFVLRGFLYTILLLN